LLRVPPLPGRTCSELGAVATVVVGSGVAATVVVGLGSAAARETVSAGLERANLKQVVGHLALGDEASPALLPRMVCGPDCWCFQQRERYANRLRRRGGTAQAYRRYNPAWKLVEAGEMAAREMSYDGPSTRNVGVDVPGAELRGTSVLPARI